MSDYELMCQLKLVGERQQNLLEAIAGKDYAKRILVEEYGRQCTKEATMLARGGYSSSKDFFESYDPDQLPF